LYVTSLAIDGFDDLYVAMAGSVHNVTEIYAGGQRRVVMGNGSNTPRMECSPPARSLYGPSALALGPNGIAIADAGTHYVYLIDNSGIIHIVAGNGTTTTSNANLATGTALLTPDGLVIDAAGDIYIADDTANIVYAVYSIISNGTDIYPVIGTGAAGYTGDGGPSTAATINAPLAIALDGSSDLFVIDSGNSALREVTYPVTSYISFGNVLVNTTSAPPMLQFLATQATPTLRFPSIRSPPPIQCTTPPSRAVLPRVPPPWSPAASATSDTPSPLRQSAPPRRPVEPHLQLLQLAADRLLQLQRLLRLRHRAPAFTLTNPETEVYGYSFSES